MRRLEIDNSIMPQGWPVGHNEIIEGIIPSANALAE